MSNEGQGHIVACLSKGHNLSNNAREYEVNQLTNEKVTRGKRNLNRNCLQRRPPTHPTTRPDGFTNLKMKKTKQNHPKLQNSSAQSVYMNLPFINYGV